MDLDKRPDISIISSAYRPQNWTNFYDSIGKSDVSFELIFVGPNEPQFPLPKNFRFLKSNVKPVQCFEIALRNSRAEHVMYVADDCEFITEKPLEKLMSLYIQVKDPKCMVSCRYMMDGTDLSDSVHRFFAEDPTSPIMPLSGLAKKAFLEKIGGVDRNFIAVMWDLDVAMRIYQDGGHVVLSDVFLNEDKNRSAGSLLCSEFWGHDRMLLEDLWTENGKTLRLRKRKVASFSDDEIMTRSQGPRGRWQGTEPYWIEKIVDSEKAAGRSTARLTRRVVSLAGLIFRRLASPAKYSYYLKKVGRRKA